MMVVGKEPDNVAEEADMVAVAADWVGRRIGRRGRLGGVKKVRLGGC